MLESVVPKAAMAPPAVTSSAPPTKITQPATTVAIAVPELESAADLATDAKTHPVASHSIATHTAAIAARASGSDSTDVRADEDQLPPSMVAIPSAAVAVYSPLTKSTEPPEAAAGNSVTP